MMNFLRNVSDEFKKITWPTEKEWMLYSLQVFVFVAVLAAFFALVDGGIAVAMYYLD